MKNNKDKNLKPEQEQELTTKSHGLRSTFDQITSLAEQRLNNLQTSLGRLHKEKDELVSVII